MTTHTHVRATASHRPVLKGFFARLNAAVAAWRQRRALAELDDAALRDIGISRGEAMTEASRPVWDVPSHWLR